MAASGDEAALDAAQHFLKYGQSRFYRASRWIADGGSTVHDSCFG